MKREDLLAGTRPDIVGGRVILSGADGFDGYEIMEYKGMVWGISVRARSPRVAVTVISSSRVPGTRTKLSSSRSPSAICALSLRPSTSSTLAS